MGIYSITDGKGLRDLSGSFSKSLVPVRQGEKEFSHQPEEYRWSEGRQSM